MLLFAGAAVAASFLFARFVELPGLIEPLWKTAGIVLLGLFAALSGAWLAAMALFASSSGDFFLDLKPPMMIAGMASFAVAHLFFIAAFATRIGKGGMRTNRWPFAALIVLASSALLIWFWPDMGELRAPGIVYHLILTAMVISSLMAPVSTWATAGAVLFMISDCFIALGLYKEMGPFPLLIWTTYAAAQVMLAHGLTRRGV